MRKISYCEALNEAMTQEMERDPSVFVYGIGVPDHKRIFGSTDGLVEKFGAERCFDTPLAEDAMTGFGLGAAILLDATIVRSLLVPSVLRILGNTSWYFPAVLRWIPNVSIEGKPLDSLSPTSLPKPISGAED